MLRSAEALQAIKTCDDFGVVGVETGDARIDLEKVQQRKQRIVLELAWGSKLLLSSAVRVAAIYEFANFSINNSTDIIIKRGCVMRHIL